MPGRKAKSENLIIPNARPDNRKASNAKSENVMNLSAKSVTAVEVIPFGGLGATVEPKLLEQMKILCSG